MRSPVRHRLQSHAFFKKNLGAISLQVSKCGAQKLEERGRDLSLIENPFDHNYLKKRYKQHYMSIRHQNQLEGSLPKNVSIGGRLPSKGDTHKAKSVAFLAIFLVLYEMGVV